MFVLCATKSGNLLKLRKYRALAITRRLLKPRNSDESTSLRMWRHLYTVNYATFHNMLKRHIYKKNIKTYARKAYVMQVHTNLQNL